MFCCDRTTTTAGGDRTATHVAGVSAGAAWTPADRLALASYQQRCPPASSVAVVRGPPSHRPKLLIGGTAGRSVTLASGFVLRVRSVVTIGPLNHTL